MSHVHPPENPPTADMLSTREQEVLGLIAHGLSNVQIAEHTMLSINSIKSCIRSAYRKIGVEQRTHAITWALANGYDARG